MGKGKSGKGKSPMTKKAAARIQSSYAKNHGGTVRKGSFPTRAQKAAAKKSSKK